MEQLIFVGCFAPGANGAIGSYHLDTETGRLDPLEKNCTAENVLFLALSPDRQSLYSIDVPGDFQTDPGYVVSWEITGERGELRRINRRSSNGISPCYVRVDPTGTCLIVANYTSSSIAAMPILADGSLGLAGSVLSFKGASMVNAERQDAPHPHCVEFSPDGHFVFLCDLGRDQIRSYRLDAATATLSPTDQAYVRTLDGAGPRHFCFRPNGRNAYVNNELANSVIVYDYDGENGRLTEVQTVSSLPADFDGDSLTADIKITPDGRFLYCSNRLHDSIASYRIADDGRLSIIDIQASHGHFAQNLAITDDSSTLVCCNMGDENNGGANIVVFRIDRDDGTLTALDEPTTEMRPACSMIV